MPRNYSALKGCVRTGDRGGQSENTRIFKHVTAIIVLTLMILLK